MADLSTALVKREDLVARMNLKGEVFDYPDGGDDAVALFLNGLIDGVSVEVQGRIGNDYNTDAAREKGIITQAEMLLCMADTLESIDVIRATAREDPFPPEYEDVAGNAEKAAGWRERADTLLLGFVDDEELIEEGDNPDGFAMGGVAVDETETDNYDDIDFGEIEVEP